MSFVVSAAFRPVVVQFGKIRYFFKLARKMHQDSPYVSTCVVDHHYLVWKIRASDKYYLIHVGAVTASESYRFGDIGTIFASEKYRSKRMTTKIMCNAVNVYKRSNVADL